MSENHVDVSLVMPAYNEEDKIEEAISRVYSVVKETGLRYELIIVNNWSEDSTQNKSSILSQYNSNVKVFGKGFLWGRVMRLGGVFRKLAVIQSCSLIVTWISLPVRYAGLSER